MDTIKNKPGSPLPWVLDGDEESVEVTAKDGTLINSAARCNFDNYLSFKRRCRDLNYGRHAANAYPKLVEALREAMHYSDYCANNGGQQADKDHAKFAALLRDLGEVS